MSAGVDKSLHSLGLPQSGGIGQGHLSEQVGVMKDVCKSGQN